MHAIPCPRLALFAAALAAGAGLSAADILSVSVSSVSAKDYTRTRQADGLFTPELYVIANGGKFPGTVRDETFDRIGYPQVAGIVAQHLAKQSYFLAPKIRDASLLIVIYWGQTIAFDDARYRNSIDHASNLMATAMRGISPSAGYMGRFNGSGFGLATPHGDSTTEGDKDSGANEFALTLMDMESLQRDSENLFNAKLLGYVGAINERREIPPWADVGGVVQELQSDVEEARYYVIVAAYDFTLMKEKKRKALRWVTRISVGSRGNAFDQRVAQMVASASSSFGQGGGLRRHQYGDAKVILGETKYLGEATAADLKQDEKSAPAK